MKVICEMPDCVAERDSLKAQRDALLAAGQELLLEISHYGTHLTNPELRQQRIDSMKAAIQEAGQP